jgi:6-phosphofructokinase 1
MGKNILIAHGGGPTAVINSSLYGVIEAARKSGKVSKIYGARFGAEGLIRNDLIDLTDITSRQLELLKATPASAIGSCRRKINDADYPALMECFRKNQIDCFFYNGGNDSMDTCNKISEISQREALDLCVMGIPKTMDNDLCGTDHCPGFGSAARYAAISAAELALDASALPIHVVVMELMGRNAGWVTAASSIAGSLTGCATMTYLPEIAFDEEKFLKKVKDRFQEGRGLLVTVSEGIRKPDGSPVADSGIVDGFGHKVPGGTAQALSNLIMQKLGIMSRAEKPGLLGRCSVPYTSAIDRDEARAVGGFAVEAALAGKSGYMVALKAERVPAYFCSLELVPLEAVANAERKFPLEWITDDNCGIAPAFFDYCMPLMGGNMPEYAKLRE